MPYLDKRLPVLKRNTLGLLYIKVDIFPRFRNLIEQAHSL